MKQIKKLLTFMLVVTGIIAMLVFTSSAVYEVDTWDELEIALENPGTADIVLTGNIIRTVENVFDSVSVKGVKTLDLNGHTVAYYDNVGKNDVDFTSHSNHDTLFNIGSSAELTINDSSTTKIGTIIFDGWLANARSLKVIPIRDIFSIGGKLTVNGGYFSCGHEDDEWVTALRLNGSLYTGYVNKQVYGTPLVVCYGGELVVNDGGFGGRGGYYIKDKTNVTNYTGAAVYCSYGSKTTINGGSFLGMGGADIFCADSRAEITVKSGTFKTKGIDKAIVRNNNYDAGNLEKGYMHLRSDMIADGIEKKVIVADGNVYAYAAGAKPETFDWSTVDTVVYDAIGFKSQSPAMPEGKNVEYLGECNVNYNKIISFEEKPLDAYLKKLGVSVLSSLVVRNSSNAIVYSTPAAGLKSYNFKNAAPDTYTATEQITLTYGGKVISKLEHVFVVDMKNFCSHTYTTISDTATCTGSGIKTERCTLCGDEKTSTSAALGHLSLSSDWAYNSTHHWYYCRRCNTILTKDAHTFASASNRTCVHCRYNDNCEWGNAMDTEHDEKYHWWPCDTHSLDDECPNNHQLEKELHTVCTIENAGSLEHDPEIEYSCVNGYVCDGCGEYFGETGEHKWEQIPAREGGIKVATCITSGYIKYRCYYNGKYDCKGNKITCSATKTVTIPALGHDFDYDAPDSNTATCTEDGLYTYSCTRARCSVTTTKPSSALNHSFVDWVVETPATCTTDGLSTAACINAGCTHKDIMPIPAFGHSFGFPETVVAPTCTEKGKNVAKCTAENCNATQETEIEVIDHSFTEKIIDQLHLVSPATTESPAIYKYDCAGCDAISDTLTFTHGEKLTALGKTDKITAVQNTSAIKLTWTAVDGAAGYRVYQKVGEGWKALGNVTGTTAIINNLTAGTKYSFAVKAGAIVDGSVVWATDYTTINTATQAIKPVKVAAAQNTSAIKLAWTACPGATGYRIYYKSGNIWKVSVSTTAATSHMYTNLKAGAKYTFAIRPYILVDGVVIWSDYVEFTTATKPAAPVAKASSPSKGKITLTYSAVNGADGYQVYYSENGGAYKLYKVYTAAGTLNFANLKSGTKYTFAVRAGIRTSGGNIYGGYNPVTVTVK
ncbi:MAG: hypothetical protein E7544_07170 [Ruminococcaceae bacterium]|nr:hypothetical protein [Oscillospiraceae bacterium]